jgi:hypothetical protein
MATVQVPTDRQIQTPTVNVPFTPEQYRRMAEDDILAGKTLALLLAGVIVVGTLLGAIAVLFTL